jgi:hypothetical protein
MDTAAVYAAEKRIADIIGAGERLALAVRTVQELEDTRPLVKSDAIRRLMGMTNPETGKPHSASSAEKIVESDGEYLAHRRQQANAEVEKHRAFARYEASKLQARLAVAAAEGAL